MAGSETASEAPPSKGRVVFSLHAYTGKLNVVRVDYDPEEDGR